MLRRASSNRKLLRKRMYKAPHTRHRNSIYYRENKNLTKPHQDEYKKSHAPVVKRKRRPKREVVSGFSLTDISIISMMLWKKKRMRIRMNRFILNSGLEKYETGNPIIALLIVLSLLGVSTKRRK